MRLPRLYPILDTAALAARSLSMESAAQAMLDGGANILQIRHKGHWTRALFESAVSVRARCQDVQAPLLVNDRADYAVLLDAGLHIGQDDLPAAEARRLIGSRPLGFSTHNDVQLRAAGSAPVDYLAIGPIFSTSSKHNPDPQVGLDRLRQWRPLTTKPLVAIGGITRSTARATLDAGADSVAVIGDLLPDPCTEKSVRQRMEQWQQLLKP